MKKKNELVWYHWTNIREKVGEFSTPTYTVAAIASGDGGGGGSGTTEQMKFELTGKVKRKKNDNRRILESF